MAKMISSHVWSLVNSAVSLVLNFRTQFSISVSQDTYVKVWQQYAFYFGSAARLM